MFYDGLRSVDWLPSVTRLVTHFDSTRDSTQEQTDRQTDRPTDRPTHTSDVTFFSNSTHCGGGAQWVMTRWY